MSNGNASNNRGRKWCFTLNNYTAAEEKHITDTVDEGTATYVCFGKEIGDSGTPHLQGYVEFPKKLRFGSVRKILPRAHIEKAKTQKEAIAYCKKDGNWIEKGTIQVSGRRVDLELIRSDIASGASEISIADKYFSQWCQYRRSFDVYRGLVSGSRNWDTWVCVLWGKTGTGKTRIVHYLYGSENIFTYSGGGWFDGYRGQPIVLFDDFRGAEDGISPGLLLRLLDRYPMQVPIKGSFANWIPRKVYFTSNIRPDDWFPELTFDAFQAFKRRLNKVEYIEEDIFIN